MRTERDEHVTRAIAELPAVYREIIRLFDYEGLGSKDVARIMGRSQGAVLMLHTRARAALTEHLAAHLNDLMP